MSMEMKESLTFGQRVKVYLNLNKCNKTTPSIFSIVDMKSGKVVAYSQEVTLLNAIFKVSEAGRTRVIRERRKHVHAWVIGEYAGNNTDASLSEEVYYNPYTTPKFMSVQTEKSIESAPIAHFRNRRVWIESEA